MDGSSSPSVGDAPVGEVPPVSLTGGYIVITPAPRPRSPLTVRTVQQLLTKAGVDYTLLGFGERHGTVIVTGPRPVRSRAGEVLYDAYLSNAPYPDHDEWRR